MRKTKEENIAAARKHNAEMLMNNGDLVTDSIMEARIADGIHREQDPVNEETHFLFWNTDTVSALFKAAELWPDSRIGVLNFADCKTPGGRYLNGAYAQEEALCHASTLYPVLKHFQQDYYDVNAGRMNAGLYADRALITPDILFEKDNHSARAAVISCAAPNYRFGRRFRKFTLEEDLEALKDRFRFLNEIIDDEGINVFITGAFGCGVFAQPPLETARLTRECLSRGRKKIIILAVPGTGKNPDAFAAIADKEES